jgi:cytochrome c553
MTFASAASLASLITMLALGGATAARAGGDKELGEYLSNECVTCHQVSGKYDGIPSIVGWPEESFIHALGEYRAKIRTNAVMRSIAVKFTDEEIAALASYFGSAGSQSLPATTGTTAAQTLAGE